MVMEIQMVPATVDEIAGLKRLAKFIEKKNCEDVTGERCGAFLSDQCDVCIEIEAALVYIRNIRIAGA